MKIKKGRQNRDFLISICLVVNPDSPQGVSETIRNRVREWEKAGLIPNVPVSNGLNDKVLKSFIERYSEDVE